MTLVYLSRPCGNIKIGRWKPGDKLLVITHIFFI
jgi:hypothetical protein